METFIGLLGTVIWLLRIAVPIYLYNDARRINLPKPGWWILFGLLEPVVAIMIYYLIQWLRLERNSEQQNL